MIAVAQLGFRTCTCRGSASCGVLCFAHCSFSFVTQASCGQVSTGGAPYEVLVEWGAVREGAAAPSVPAAKSPSSVGGPSGLSRMRAAYRSPAWAYEA
eukprot:scaffold46429_cov44-Phaeocystis_antarctica.AAC.2